MRGNALPLPAYLSVFDTETTGPDPEQDRIVTAFIGRFNTRTGDVDESWTWVLDPGVPISEGATAVHGYSTDDVRFIGTDAAEGVFAISQRLDILQREGLPMVAYNARFDMTLLTREYERHYVGGRPFEPSVVIDPYVIDKAVDTYRKGGRKLVDVAAHYGVPVEKNAHDAEADCRMAGRIAVALLSRGSLQRMSLEELHEYQKAQAIVQARSLRAYFKKKGNEEAARSVRFEWPVTPKDHA